MMKLLKALPFILIFSIPMMANAAKYNEGYYCDIVAEQLNGKSEIRTTYNKRVDIVTATHAIECDWLPKWGEAIGQAMTYAELEGKLPGIVIFHDVNKKWNENTYQLYKHMSSVLGITLWIYEVNKKDGKIEFTEQHN